MYDVFIQFENIRNADLGADAVDWGFFEIIPVSTFAVLELLL